jgi:hypothetical protein
MDGIGQLALAVEQHAAHDLLAIAHPGHDLERGAIERATQSGHQAIFHARSLEPILKPVTTSPRDTR